MKLYKRICRICGKTFETENKGRGYCDECKRLGRHPPRKCKACGRMFEPHRSSKSGKGNLTQYCDECKARMKAGVKLSDIQRHYTNLRLDENERAARASGMTYGVWSALRRMEAFSF